jgi:glycosyltransferase involved in cell wall biosynthesis
MHIGFYSMSLSGTGGVRVTIDLCKVLIDSGHKVSLIVNDVHKVPFSLPDKLMLYKMSAKTLKPIELEQNNWVDSGQSSLANTAKKRLPNWVVNLFVKVKYHIFRLELNNNKQHLVEQLKILDLDRVVSTNIYNRLEYTELFSDICPTLIHVHNDLIDVCSRRNFNYVGNVTDFYKNFRLIFISIDQRRRAVSKYSVGHDSAVVYNPIDFERLINQSQVKVENELSNYLIFVGSLTERKRVNLVIEALAKADTSYNLLILGEGPNMESLKELVIHHGLTNRVKFGGFLKNPYPFIKDSKGLILASSYEGLPTVLIESLVLETPIIAVDCPTGPKEIMAAFDLTFLVKNGPEQQIINDLAVKLEVLESSTEHSFTDVEIFSETRNIDAFVSQLKQS